MMSRRLSLRSIASCTFAVVLAVVLTACGDASSNARPYSFPKSIKSEATQLVDKNERFSLEWNEEQFCALIRDNGNGRVWSTTPYDIWETGGSSSISSAIYIEYYNMSTGILEETRASVCVENETVSVTVKNGVLREEFYFDAAGIMVPLEYTLTNNGMHVEIKGAEIQEKSNARLISVSFLPYMASAMNTTSKDTYLVAPVGSGAISYTAPEMQNGSRSLELPVYGTDMAQHRVVYSTEDVKVNLPVFGVRAESDALFAEISAGAESAELHIESGNIRTEHSTVYPKFIIHGYDRFEVEMQDWEDDNIYNDKLNLSSIYAVDYYPLSDGEVSYSAMAKFYRDEILSLKPTDSDGARYNVTLLGGTMLKKFILGIPTEKLYAMTNFEEAETILSELGEASGDMPQAVLYGFGKSGVDIGEIGGGFNFATALGGKNGAAELEEFCEKNNIKLFTDFQITSFKKSGSGFSTGIDVAKNASLQYSYYYMHYKNLPQPDTSTDKIRCLKRDLLNSALEKLLSFADKRISGISFSDLGYTAYSDYRNEEYYVKGNMPLQVEGMLKNVKEAGHSLSLREANGYAAYYADSITDVPLDNGGYSIFDEAIPFYQMVFRGNAALYGKAINTAANDTQALLNSVEYGVYPAFTLCANYDKSLIDSYSSEIYGSAYTPQLRARVSDIVKQTKAVYEAIENSRITEHYRSGKLAVTKYENGVTVYVNYSEEPIRIDDVEVQAENFEFKLMKGAEN